MRTLYTVIMFLCVSVKLFAQDVIVLKSGDEISAKILEVDELSVKYKKWDYQDGPNFTINKSKIFMIKYQNGSKEVISSDVTEKKETSEVGYGKNLFSTNVLSILSFSYERLSKNEKFGFRIPVAYPILFSLDRKIELGFDGKFYIGQTKLANYFLGPSLQGGILVLANYNTINFASLFFNNGISMNPAKGFNLTVAGAAGIGSLFYYRPRYTFDWRVEVTLGARF